MGLNSTPASWTAGEIPTAAKMNTEIRDAATGIQAGWTAYTPVWNALTTAPVIGNGTIAGSYYRVGKTVHYRIRIVAGSTTTYGTGTYTFTLPVTPNPVGNDVIGQAVLLDSSAPTRVGRTGYLSSGVIILVSELGAIVTGAVPYTWAVSDSISVAGTYEAA